MIEYLVNPLWLFLAVWATTLAFYAGGVFTGVFPSPHALTVVALALNIIVFSLGYLTRRMLKGSGPPPRDLPGLAAKPLTETRLRCLLNFTLLMGTLSLLLILYRIAVIASLNHIDFWTLLTDPYLLRTGVVTFIAGTFRQTSLMTMSISLTSGLFAIGFVALGVFLYLDATVWRYVYLVSFVGISLASSLISLSRYDMTVSIMYLILAYCVMRVSGEREKRKRIIRDLLLPAGAVVGIFVAVELLLVKSATYGEPGSLRGILFSFYWYLASPTAAFDVFLNEFPGDFGFGKNTFFPFFKWLGRFHVIDQPTISVFGEFVYLPYPANVYTYLRHFYEDFGLLGVALIPYGLGWLMAAIKDRATRHLPFLILYVFLLVPILFSFYSYPLLSSQFYMQILFGFLFFRGNLIPSAYQQE